MIPEETRKVIEQRVTEMESWERKAIWKWLGMSRTEYDKFLDSRPKNDLGCIVIGCKEPHTDGTVLCEDHMNKFQEWRSKQ